MEVEFTTCSVFAKSSSRGRTANPLRCVRRVYFPVPCSNDVCSVMMSPRPGLRPRTSANRSTVLYPFWGGRTNPVRPQPPPSRLAGPPPSFSRMARSPRRRPPSDLRPRPSADLDRAPGFDWSSRSGNGAGHLSRSSGPCRGVGLRGRRGVVEGCRSPEIRLNSAADVLLVFVNGFDPP